MTPGSDSEAAASGRFKRAESQIAAAGIDPHLGERALVFVAVAGIVGYLALDGGGYDVVVRQQVAVAVWVAIAAGFAAGLLPRGRPGRALLVPAIAAAALAVWLGVSLSWTESTERTSIELFRLLGYVGIAILAVSGLHRMTFAAAAAGATVAVVGVSALAVASRLFPGAIDGSQDVAGIFAPDRLNFPLDYWNAVGAWGAIGIAMCLAWSAHSRAPLARAIAAGAVPICGACVYLTYSRGGLLGSGAAVLAVIVLSRKRWTVLAHALAAGGTTAAVILAIQAHDEIADATGGAGGGTVAVVVVLAALICAAAALGTRAAGIDRWRLSPVQVRRGLPVVAVVVIGLGAVAAHGPISRAWDEFRAADRVTVSGAARLTTAGGDRSDLWASALDAFAAHPLGGTGAGTYEFWWSRDARDKEYVRNAHSLYLESLAETGAPGFLLLLTLLAGALWVALRARQEIEGPTQLAASIAMCAAFCVFLVNAGVDWIWQVTALGAVGLGGVAIAAAPATQARRSGDEILRPWLRVAVVLGALVAGVVQLPSLVSTERLRASQAAARVGDLERSQALAEDAVDAMPWAATPYEQLALVEEERGHLAAANRQVRRAIDREPTNWRYPLLLARIQAEQGNRAAARRTFRQGKRLRPLSPAYSPRSSFGREVFGDRR